MKVSLTTVALVVLAMFPFVHAAAKEVTPDEIIAACDGIKRFANLAAIQRYEGVSMQDHLALLSNFTGDPAHKKILKSVIIHAHKLGNAERYGYQVAISNEFSENVHQECMKWAIGEAIKKNGN